MKLHMESHGQGAHLVLIHGWGCNGNVWRQLADKLAQRFRVHCVDLPGYGHSALCQPYTIDALIAKLAHSAPERVIACGWSLGAQLALGGAAQHPRQVERLILMAATPRFV